MTAVTDQSSGPGSDISSTGTRAECDSLGDIDVPADCYWGAHTERARRNFAITGRSIASHPDFIVALAQVKQAAVRANRELGLVDPVTAAAIDAACQRIIDGEHHDQFVVDVLQGGAGTSSNMNANEVIANLALEGLGQARGQYDRVHPVDVVNRGQSTNDVYPTAAKIAIVSSVVRLTAEIELLSAAFAERGDAFSHLVKVGRTQLQDAVPMTLGQEFTGFAVSVGKETERLDDALTGLLEVNLGATAIGTGITATPGFGTLTVAHLGKITGRAITLAPNLIEATSDVGGFLTVSGAVKRAAIKISKICNDLRLLSSGPRAGFGEINLPARQAGSSIMPGKVNPVIPEAVNQVAFAIAGADLTVTMAAEAGQLQLNAFEPVILHSILQSAEWLSAACRTLREECVTGITANESHLAALLQQSTAVVTALVPYLGYAQAAQIAQRALATGNSIPEIVLDLGLLSGHELVGILSPAELAGIGTQP